MKVLRLFLFVFVVAQQAFGQTVSPIFRNMATPSPNALELAKYGDTPAALSSGTEDISLPIYLAQGRKLNAPITLRYHTSGRKVDEISSWVGYGWSLHAGGVISRTMRGLPDENEFGFLDYAANIPETSELDASTKYELANGFIDMIPDMFYFNLGSQSGKFFFGNDGLPHMMPGSDVKITADIKGAGATNTFTIIAPDGTSYIFGGEATELSSVRMKGPVVAPFTSAWYLTSIISYDKTDTITFEYDVVDYFNFPRDTKKSLLYYTEVPAGSNYHSNYEIETLTEIFQHQVANVQYLKKIVYSRGQIVFNTSPAAVDYTARKLDEIIVYSLDPVSNTYQEKKKIEFGYGVFEALDIVDTIDGQEVIKEGVDRLKLLNFGVAGMPKYHFTYNTEPVPSLGWLGQDHWGYYNGADNNTCLLPETILAGNTLEKGNSREPSAAHMKVGMLATIKSPLGGTTEYVFEPHEYWDETAKANAMAGGLRIKSIISRDPYSNINDVTSYEYVNPSTGNSSGVLLSPYGYSTSITVKEQGFDPYNCMILSAQHTSLGMTSGGSVGYEYVKVFKGNNISVAGYTLHQFNMPQDVGVAELPFVPFNDVSWSRGQTLSVKQYKYINATTTQLVSEVTNIYENNRKYFEIRGLKVSYNKLLLNVSETSSDYLIRQFRSGIGFPFLLSSTVTTYESDNSFLLPPRNVQVKENHYDFTTGHHQLISHSTTNSDGTILETEYKYPTEYTETGVMGIMKAQNLLAVPIETKSWVTKNTQRYLTGYAKTDFFSINTDGYDRVYPQYAYSAKIEAPVPESDFNANPTAYIKRQLSYVEYDAFGNVLDVSDETGSKSTNIFEKNGQRMIASVQNASKNQVAYTSFEANDFGHWLVEEEGTQETRAVVLDLYNNRLTFTIEEAQNLNITYSITRTAGDMPALRFTPATGTEILELLPSASGNVSISLFAGSWTVELVTESNVSAAQIDFSYIRNIEGILSRKQGDSRTGANSLILTVKTSILKEGLPIGKYVMTYWKKESTQNISVTNGNLLTTIDTDQISDGWQLVTNTIEVTSPNGSISITGQGLIDELRLIPEKAVINTVSYNLYDQKMDNTDHNHRSTYYEYDEHHRLIIIRDHDKNIVQHKNYGFANN